MSDNRNGKGRRDVENNKFHNHEKIRDFSQEMRTKRSPKRRTRVSRDSDNYDEDIGSVSQRQKDQPGLDQDANFSPRLDRDSKPRRSIRLRNKVKSNWKTALVAAVGLATSGTYFLPMKEACSWVSITPIAQPKPLETEYTIIGLTEKEQDRLFQLQMMDSMSREDEGPSSWDIWEVK